MVVLAAGAVTVVGGDPADDCPVALAADSLQLVEEDIGDAVAAEVGVDEEVAQAAGAVGESQVGCWSLKENKGR